MRRNRSGESEKLLHSRHTISLHPKWAMKEMTEELLAGSSHATHRATY